MRVLFTPTLLVTLMFGAPALALECTTDIDCPTGQTCQDFEVSSPAVGTDCACADGEECDCPEPTPAPQPEMVKACAPKPCSTDLECGNAELAAEWLPKMASGDARVVVGLGINKLVEDAHCADLLLLEQDGAIYAVDPAKATLRANQSVDPGRKLFGVEFNSTDATLIADGDTAQSLIANALNRGALGVAAQALGLAQRMIDLSVQYTSERKQFGVAIGSFQAVKHHMANIAYKLEYAKTPVYRAAYDIANKLPRATLSVSHAKLAACEVADLAAKNSIQVHGAMGYTWEVDLHIFMKRAWAFNSSFGTAGFHKQRVAAAILADDAPLGAGATF